jgi:predicted metal-dependent peptidase
MKYPFFGMLALNMSFRIDDNLNPPTAATNGKEIIFHPGFIRTLNDAEVLFLVGHEVLHPVLEHILRRGSRDPFKWNIAADVVVNQILTDERVGKMPDHGVLDGDLFRRGGGVVETIYSLLPQEDNEGRQPGDGQPGSSLDNCMDAPGDASQQAELQADLKTMLAQAAQVAKMRGNLSEGLKRFVEDTLNPRVDWRDVLHRFVEKARTDERSFSRVNRRFYSMGLCMPSVSGEEMGELVVAVDCSGSVGSNELNQFATEIRTIHQDSKPRAIHVVYFDSKVCHYDKFDQQEDPFIKPHGGGGTAFSPVMRYIEEHEITPVACVFLTDLCCSDFGPQPDYPVLWVSTHSDKAPWGEVVMMK